MHLSLKWRWAGFIANTESNRWAKRVTEWRDSDWWSVQPRGAASYGVRPIRARPGSFLRFEEDLRKYASHCDWDAWQSIALDTVVWDAHEEKFAEWCWR